MARFGDQNLNEFWEKPVKFYKPGSFLRAFLSKLRAFTTILPFRKSLMEKTRILNDNPFELRQKGAEPCLRQALVSHGK